MSDEDNFDLAERGSAELLATPKAETESYAHALAKQVLCGWLREAPGERLFTASSWGGFRWCSNRGGPSHGVWMEYPLDGSGIVWDERHEWLDRCGIIDPSWSNPVRPPTYEECLAMELPPVAIVDIAIQHKGSIIIAIEICHKHPVPRPKLEWLWTQGLDVFEVPSRWVLGQIRCPDQMPDFRLHDDGVRLHATRRH